MSEEPLDPELLVNVMRMVRVEVVQPMLIRVRKMVKGQEVAKHVFEIALKASVEEVQREVSKVASKWPGKFPIGCQFIVERVQ